ncbi:hypothetical protein ACWGLF_28855 [Streptomyces puniciscabiei]
MTTDVDLPAVRESLRAAVEHHAAELLEEPPHLLFDQVRDAADF